MQSFKLHQLLRSQTQTQSEIRKNQDQQIFTLNHLKNGLWQTFQILILRKK